MEGFKPNNGFSNNSFSNGGFTSTGFQDEGFNQGGFQPVSNSQQTGFQPQGTREVRVNSEDLMALRDAIARAKDGLAAAETVLKKLEFLPESNNGF